jgi:hypothetical protein
MSRFIAFIDPGRSYERYQATSPADSATPTCESCPRPANADSGLCCGCEDRRHDAERGVY